MANNENTVFKDSSRGRSQESRKLSLTFRDRSIFISKKFVIGREDGNDIALKEDPLVSRRHAMIEFSQGSYSIRDLGSTNGTYVNGNPLKKGERRALFDGDVISIGKTKINVSGKME